MAPEVPGCFRAGSVVGPLVVVFVGGAGGAGGISVRVGPRRACPVRRRCLGGVLEGGVSGRARRGRVRVLVAEWGLRDGLVA